MKPTSYRLYGLIFAACSVAAGVGIAACVSDSDTPAGETPDSSAADSATPDSSTPTATDDASTPTDPDAGEEITDGGGLPPEDDEDGGATDLDGGFDGGAACASLGVGTFVESSCAFLTKAMSGGDLSSGTYVLTSVAALGSKTYCAAGGGYVAYDHRGTLEVTATSTSAATFEFIDQYRKTGGNILTRPTTLRYDVAVAASGTTLTYTAQPCAAKAAPASALYSTGVTADSKKTITLRLPYGTGSANFYYVEQ